MSTRLTDCEKCNSIGSLFKVLNKPVTVVNQSQEKEKKVGQVTKQFIEEAKEELKQQKQDEIGKEFLPEKE